MVSTTYSGDHVANSATEGGARGFYTKGKKEIVLPADSSEKQKLYFGTFKRYHQ